MQSYSKERKRTRRQQRKIIDLYGKRSWLNASMMGK